MSSLFKRSLSKHFILASLLLVLASVASAQSTTVSGQVTDSAGQAWNNGTYAFQFVPNNQYPFSNYSWTGGTLNQNAAISGSLNATGGYSQAVPSSTAITPTGSQWRLQVCSGTVPVNCFTVTQSITGGSQTVNVTPPPIVVPPGAGNTAYNTNEVSPAVVGSQIYIIGSGLQLCSVVTAGSCTTWSGSSSSSPSSPSAYTFSVSAGTVTALPNLPNGSAAFTGSDACVVWNSMTNALATVGAFITVRIGVYNCNSLTLDATPGCSNFAGSGAALAYGFGFPANTFPTSVQWIVQGEAAPVWMGESLATTVNTAGVVFNITSTAVSSVAAGSILAGTWQKPNTNCTLTASNVSNDVHLKNIGVRFPANTRGNECAVCMWFTNTMEYENILADFAQTYNAIATGAAPTKGSYGSFGITSSVSSSGNWQFFKNTYATGYDLLYDFNGEHIWGTTVTGIYGNFACEWGRSATTVFHPSKIENFIDQENGAGCIWGPQMVQASAVDIYFDFEFGNDGNWYTTARAKTAKLTETNCNIGTGIIRYGVVIQNQGSVAEVPGVNLFTSCGGNFSFQEVAQPLNYAQVPASDPFTRPNSSSLGPAWAIPGPSTGACNMAIASNAATSGVGQVCLWVSQPANADQFAKATINTIDASGLDVIVRGSISANTYYDYGCTSNAGQVLRRRVAGTFMNITTSATNCAIADVLELKVIGTSLYAFRNGVLSLTGTDANITSGFPGVAAGAVTDSLTGWAGGSLPLLDQTRSQASQLLWASGYNTFANCSSSGGTCGAASAGSVSIAAAATTVTVATTAVTANSQIILTRDDTLGTKLSVTCNTATAAGDIKVSTRTAGTSFVITVQNAPAVNPLCLSYSILN